MATFKFGRFINMHWNGYDIVGPADTIFSIPDQLYEEFDADISPVEPTLVWLDTNEFQTLKDTVDAELPKSVYTASMYFAAGQVETLNRAYITGTSQRPQQGRTHLQFFVAPDTITVGTATVWVQATGTGITLARMGLYTWDETTGTATLVARTANDTTIAGTASTLQSRAFDTTGGYPSTYTLTAGSAYAFGFITVGTTAPQILTTALAGDSNISTITPRVSAAKTSQTDLQTVSAAFTNVQFSIWGRFS